jgi:hypothetical protein
MMKLSDPDYTGLSASISQRGAIVIKLRKRPFWTRFRNHYRWCRRMPCRLPRWRAVRAALRMARL